MAKVIEAFHDNMKCILNMYVLAVINYGIGHLSESVKQTNILNVLNRCLKHVTTTTCIDNTKWICST